MSGSGEDRPGGPRMFFAAGPGRQLTQNDFDQMEKDAAERTYKVSRLHIAAVLLSGAIAARGDGVEPSSPLDFDEALAVAERLMKANEDRKVVML